MYDSFDLITSRPVEKGEYLAFMLPVKGEYPQECDFEKKLYDNRFRINYFYEGIEFGKSFKKLITQNRQEKLSIS